MSRVSRAIKITGKLIRFAIGLVIFSVIAILIWRVTSSSDPKELEGLSHNAKLAAAYEEHGDELRVFKQDQRSITSGNDNYGYFSVTDYAFIPEANQIQLLFRYNNSTIRAAVSDYELESVPEREENIFDVTLLFSIDKTPENDEDNFGNDSKSVKFIRAHGTVTASVEKNIYNFRRFVFDLDESEVDLEELLESGLLLAVYADVYYEGDIDYDAKPYGTLCLYDFLEENIEIKPSKSGIKALETYEE